MKRQERKISGETNVAKKWKEKDSLCCHSVKVLTFDGFSSDYYRFDLRNRTCYSSSDSRFRSCVNNILWLPIKYEATTERNIAHYYILFIDFARKMAFLWNQRQV